MVPSYLREFLTPEQAQASFVPAHRLRAQAAEMYRRRADAIDTLSAQVDAGLWHLPAVQATITAARRDYALLWYQRRA